jgi:hypothetical protein
MKANLLKCEYCNKAVAKLNYLSKQKKYVCDSCESLLEQIKPRKKG